MIQMRIFPRPSFANLWCGPLTPGHISVMFALAVMTAGVALSTGTALRAQELEDDVPPANLDMPLALEMQQGRGPVTNLPLPRYVSLKGSEGNARRGPSLSHRIDWVFKHAGMPLKITAEFSNWRRVEDRDGAGGWIHYTLLSGVRTAVVEDPNTQLHARPDSKSAVVATAEAGAIARLGDCSIDWCQLKAEAATGWVEKSHIWGVDPQETRD